MYLKAQEVWKKKYGKFHNLYATSCNNLGTLYIAKNDYHKAQAYLIEGRDIRAKVLGKSNFEYAQSCRNLANFYCRQEKYLKAEPLFREAKDILLAQLDKNFNSLSEREQELYTGSLKAFFNDYIRFAVIYYSLNESVASDLFDLRLITKGLILQSSQKLRQKITESGDTLLIKKYETLRKLRNHLGILHQLPLKENESKNLDEKVLSEKVNTIERELKQEVHGIELLEKSKFPNWREIMSKLKSDEIAVEIIQYSGETVDDTIYVALIIDPETKRQPKLILLESGSMMESRGISYYRNSILNRIEDTISYNLFWKPIAEKMHGVNKVFFSPDGVYNKISLATLKNPLTGKFLSDEINVQVVNSARSIVQKRTVSKANKAFLFGFPDYKDDGISKSVDHDERREYTPDLPLIEIKSDTNRSYLNSVTGEVTPLPGTKTEVYTISQYLSDKNIPAELFIGKEANEKQVKEIRDPKILHIATHGFFLPDIGWKGREHNLSRPKFVQNPLFRSGLLLAGCEKSLNSEAFPLGDEDGILTAYEAMNLFLDETDLVVLSACETGLGEIENGEGVYGLQRAFQQAGAKAVLISLWKVDDNATQLLMKTFYKEYLQSGDLRQSFSNARSSVRVQYPQPYYWGAFVLVE